MNESRGTPSESQFRLLIFGNGSVRTVPLTGTQWTIGRGTDCSIVLRDPTVSRKHVQIDRTGDTFTFRDLGGSNPVQLDGRPMRQGTLTVGSSLIIGLTRLQLEVRTRPSEITTDPRKTIVLSREVLDPDAPAGQARSLTATAARVLERIEWTFADLGDLSEVAQPLLELAVNLTSRHTGWIGRLDEHGKIEALATTSSRGGEQMHLSEQTLAEARALRQPYLLVTQHGEDRTERLIVPLGNGPSALLVLESPSEDAPTGQELLRLAHSLGVVIWHRLQEATERKRLRDELQRLRFHGTAAHNALLTSTRLQPVREVLRTLSGTDAPVLLLGEEGTEREDLARFLHAESPRKHEQFLTFNAAIVPAFRHERDLFGERSDVPGLVQRAEGGTLLVVHPTRLSPACQQRLVARLRASADGKPPARLVLAASAPIDDSGDWHPDLAHWLNGGAIEVPPLRSDARDIAALAELFLSELGPRPDGSPRLMSTRTKGLLTAYGWPGNTRELRLVLESASAQAGNQPIAPRHLPAEIAQDAANTANEILTLDEVERLHILEVMQRLGGNRARVAQALGIANSTLYEKLKRYRIEG
jgi:transcriptional regulator with AAA-type ATPase domain/pSer/pThr/pTyr-binding forkhead associated (FHA) protein